MLDLDELEAKAKAAGPAWVKDGPWAETCVRPAEVLALIRELRDARAAVAAEREACAEAARSIAIEILYEDALFAECESEVAYRIERDIRARGAKGESHA